MDPTYIRDHPLYGIAGIDHIFRFDNGLGIRKHRHVARDSGWNVDLIRFLGVEVTNFEVVTVLGTGLATDAVTDHCASTAAMPPDDKAIGANGQPVVVQEPPVPEPAVLSSADEQVVADEAAATVRDDASNAPAPAGTIVKGK